VKELVKLALLLQHWPWPKLGFVLVVGLLFRQVVNFEQAIALILLAIVIDKLGGRRPPSQLQRGKGVKARTSDR
jgi:hypothetical protein